MDLWTYTHTVRCQSGDRKKKSVKVNLYCSLVRFQRVSQLQVVLLASSECLPALRCSPRQVWRGSVLCVAWCIWECMKKAIRWGSVSPSCSCDGAEDPRLQEELNSCVSSVRSLVGLSYMESLSCSIGSSGRLEGGKKDLIKSCILATP